MADSTDRPSADGCRERAQWAARAMEHDGDTGAIFRVHWDEHLQLIRVDWAPGSRCGEADARASLSAVSHLGQAGAPLLVDMRRMVSLDRGAREVFKRDKAGAPAMALIVASPLTRMLANFFMKTDTDGIPTRMFNSESDAVVWLRERRR